MCWKGTLSHQSHGEMQNEKKELLGIYTFYTSSQPPGDSGSSRRVEGIYEKFGQFIIEVIFGSMELLWPPKKEEYRKKIGFKRQFLKCLTVNG